VETEVQEEGAKWVGRPAGHIEGLEVMAGGVRAGTHSESWRENVPDCRRYNAETAGAK